MGFIFVDESDNFALVVKAGTGDPTVGLTESMHYISKDIPFRRVLPFAHLATLLIVLALNILAVLLYSSLLWVTVPTAGFAFTAMLSIVHEAAHRTYFRGRRGNEWVGRAAALSILMNFSIYRRDHMRHHADLGGPRDAEETLRIDRLGNLVTAILLNRHVIMHWRQAIVGVADGRAIRRDTLALLIVSGALVSATLLAPSEAALTYWLPFAISIILDSVISLPEHAVIRGRAGETPPTRSIDPGPSVAFLLYYVNRHEAHHSSPRVSAVDLDVQANASGYVKFYLLAVKLLAA